MDFAQLQTLVLSWLDDPLAAYFTIPQISTWINNAQRECQKELLQAGDNYYVERMQGVTIQNQATYALPADFRFLHKFEVVISGNGTSNETRQTMREVTYQQLDQQPQAPGVPCVYNIRRNIVTIKPVPDNAYTLYLSQSYRVVDMVNPTDLPDIPQDYHEYLAVLATIDGFLKDQRDSTPFVQGKFARYQTLMKQDAQRRDVSRSRFIISSDDEYGILW